MTSTTLYRWPPNARFGTVVPKTALYNRAKISTAVRERLVADVQRITWAYKLADATIHLRGSAEVPEIQVFVVEVKDADVTEVVLAAIDRAVRFPIIFEIKRGWGPEALTRMTAAYKDLSGSSARLSAYFSTKWVPAGEPRTPLPPALDLPRLYDALIMPLLPIAVQPGERLSQATARLAVTRNVEREIAALDTRLRVEPQLNRKMELRREIRKRSVALKSLLDQPPQD